MRYHLILLLALSAASARATTTLEFSVAPTGATNFANAAGVATNGMAWGVIIDTSGNGFKTGQYGASVLKLLTVLTVGGVATDDYYVATGLARRRGGMLFTGSEAGNGGITTTNTVPDAGAATRFGHRKHSDWFGWRLCCTGSNYGFLTEADFTMPGAGAIQSYANDFTGADPVRSASLTIAASGVPEPAGSSLALLGFASLFLRRRRDVALEYESKHG